MAMMWVPGWGWWRIEQKSFPAVWSFVSSISAYCVHQGFCFQVTKVNNDQLNENKTGGEGLLRDSTQRWEAWDQSWKEERRGWAGGSQAEDSGQKQPGHAVRTEINELEPFLSLVFTSSCSQDQSHRKEHPLGWTWVLCFLLPALGQQEVFGPPDFPMGLGTWYTIPAKSIEKWYVTQSIYNSFKFCSKLQ